MGDTPYGLAFGNGVVISIEIGSTSTCVQYYDPAKNDEGLKLSLDFGGEKKGEGEYDHGCLSAESFPTLQQMGASLQVCSWRLGVTQSNDGH